MNRAMSRTTADRTLLLIVTVMALGLFAELVLRLTDVLATSVSEVVFASIVAAGLVSIVALAFRTPGAEAVTARRVDPVLARQRRRDRRENAWHGRREPITG